MTDSLGEFDCLIDGGPWTRGDTFEVVDPATRDRAATVAEAGPEGVDRAVSAAAEALPEWRAMPPSDRGRLLGDVANAIRANLDELARIETIENGRPIGLSKLLITGAAGYFDYYAGIPDKLDGDSIPVPGDRLDYTKHEPLGVTGHIVPWNVSLKLGARSIAPALACGNTVVAKPSPEAPVSLLRFAEIAEEAGLPEGVLNVVPGDGSNTGAAVTGHPDVRGVAFTGSRATGKTVLRAAADRIAPVSAELGGKSPSVVFPDADLERAVGGTVRSFANSGQVCYAPTRVFVHEDIYDPFVDSLVGAVESMEIGHGLDAPDIGPVITEGARDRIAGYVDDAVADGATVLTGGEIPREEGNFYTPTLLSNVDDDAPIACDEVFGPVLTVHEFSGEDEVVARANDTEYGLYAVVWTSDLARAHDLADRIEAGTVAVNEFPATFPQAPFGGHKQSGLGHEHGEEALHHYTRIKNVVVNLERE